MGRPLRDTAPGKVHLLTCRTAQAELLFIPHPGLNDVVGGVIAHYADKLKISLYAVCVLGNHYHILCSGPEAALPRFGESVNREIAHRVNRYLSRRGFVWGRRYDDQITIEEVDALKGLVYVLTNPVKHGLVNHPRNWPGISTYHQALGAKPLSYGFINYTEYHRAKKRSAGTAEIVRLADYEKRTSLQIAILPLFEQLSPKERHEKLNALLEKHIAHLGRKRKTSKQGFLGRKGVLSQPVKGQFPQNISRSPRPSCYSDSPEQIQAFRETECERRRAYTEASTRFRSGDYNVVFPQFTLLPPMHHIPSIQPRPPT